MRRVKIELIKEGAKSTARISHHIFCNLNNILFK